MTAGTRSAALRGPTLTFLELQAAMFFGALVCFLLGRLVRDSAFSTVYYPGSVLFFLGDLAFLTIPVIVWTGLRGRGRRQGVELAGAMLLPVAGTVIMGELLRAAYLLWLLTAMYPAMSAGMLAYVVSRRASFAGARREGTLTA